MDLKTRLIEVIKKSTGEEIKMNSHFIDNLGFDSLTVVEMVMNMEDEFNIEITDDEVSKLSTINVCEYKERLGTGFGNSTGNLLI